MTVESKSLSFSIFASHIGEELFVCLAWIATQIQEMAPIAALSM